MAARLGSFFAALMGTVAWLLYGAIFSGNLLGWAKSSLAQRGESRNMAARLGSVHTTLSYSPGQHLCYISQGEPASSLGQLVVSSPHTMQMGFSSESWSV